MTSYARLLRDNPDFARLWLAQVISLLGDWFTTIALSALVVQYSPGSEGLAISGLLLARFVPAMLLSPLAGVLVDRFDRKRLLVLSNLLRAFVVLMFLVATSGPEWLWLIYVLTILQFVLSSAFEPGQSAIIPAVVARTGLLLANTLVSITWSVMLALGAILGGIIATLFGTGVALLINALTFAVAAWLIAQIRTDTSHPTVDHHNRPLQKTSFREGLRFLRANPDVSSLLLIKMGGSIGSVDTLMTIFATQIFVLGASGQLSLGIMNSAYGLGSILGPLLLNRFNNGTVFTMRRLVIAGFILEALGWLGLANGVTLLIVCLALLVRAMGGSVNWTYSTVMIQKSVPDHYLGRVFSIDMAGFYLAMVTSTFLHGALVDALGGDQVQLIALGTMVVSLIPLVMWALITRWLERRQLLAAQSAAPTGD